MFTTVHAQFGYFNSAATGHSVWRQKWYHACTLPEAPTKKMLEHRIGDYSWQQDSCCISALRNRPLISMYTFSKLLVTYGQSSQQVGCINKTQPVCEEAGRVWVNCWSISIEHWLSCNSTSSWLSGRKSALGIPSTSSSSCLGGKVV